MKILFLALSMPDLDKTLNMYSELLLEFVKNGHNVYPVAPLSEDSSLKTCIRKEKGVDILRVKTQRLFNVGLIRKGIANMMLPWQFQRAINQFWGKIEFDLVIVPTPPITLASVIEKVKHRCRAKVYLILRDIFPQNAVDLGFLKKWMPVYWKFRMQEKKLYRLSDWIGCMSQGNVDHIRQHNPELDKQKLHILENFQKTEADVLTDLNIKTKYGLGGKFVVIFGGNMGIPQKLENVIDLAQACMTDYPNVVFLLIGKGTERRRIEAMVAQRKTTNVIFKESIPHHDYQRLVAQCDVGLISLNEKFTIPNIPSKTLSYFNLGVPVLASLDAATDYGKLLETAGAGLWSLAGDLDSLKGNFDKLYGSKALRQEMGRNGKAYFEKNLTVDKAYQVIMEKVNLSDNSSKEECHSSSMKIL